MITAIVAWANAKYKAGYELVFLGTFLIDCWLITATGILVEELIAKINC